VMCGRAFEPESAEHVERADGSGQGKGDEDGRREVAAALIELNGTESLNPLMIR
jgi:hypothetical protein